MCWSWSRGVAIVVAAVSLCGCGKSTSKAELAPPQAVHGKISFADNTPLRGGVIYFHPLEVNDGGLFRFEASGLVDAKGQYKLGFNGDEKGAAAGEYKVTITPRDYQELANSNSKNIPKIYKEQGTTPWQVTVNKGENQCNFEIKTK
jgi:hypothetical protein